jgi:hypothetical protein
MAGSSDYFADRSYLISFPKCGRTWLRLMMGKALALHSGVPASLNDMLALRTVSRQIPGLPEIRVTHEDRPHERSAKDLADDKRAFRHKRVILLVRDVRDVMVSLYFQNSRRTADQSLPEEMLKDIDTFVRSDVGSLDSFLTFYKIWYQARTIPRAFLLVRYEDMHADPEGELRKVLDFAGVKGLKEADIQEAVTFAKFENMRELELAGAGNRKMLAPGNVDDPESFKTRRGKVGGYWDYLSEETVEYINRRADAELPKYYGYDFASNS